MFFIVNGKKIEAGKNKDRISYETILKEAGYIGHEVLTVTYATPERQGILTSGKLALIENGMVFNVVNTGSA